MKNLKNYFKGFTLVELIIVITILAILAMIAFISFQGYVSSARDGNRVATISNIEKGLELFTIKTGKYPIPDTFISYTGGTEGKTKINQGIIGETVAKVINMNRVPLDPKDESKKYIYSTFGDNHKYYQIGINAENAQTSFMPQTYAFTPKSAIVKGNYRFDPSLPSLIVVPSSVNTASGIFDPKVCFVVDGGQNSLESSSGSCVKKDEMNLKDFDSSLVGYWDMESGTGDILYDLSGNGNHGSGSGGVVIGGTGGLVGKGTYFNGHTTFNPTGVKQFIKIEDSETLKNFGNQITISTISYAQANNNGGRFLFHRYTTPITGGQDRSYIYGNYATTSSFNGYVNTNTLTNTGYIRAGNNIIPGQSLFDYGGKYYLLTTVYNGVQFKIFTNGILSNKIDYNEKRDIYNGTGANFIGSWCTTLNCVNFPNYTFNGIIDDVKIYNRALSDEEIRQQAKIAGF